MVFFSYAFRATSKTDEKCEVAAEDDEAWAIGRVIWMSWSALRSRLELVYGTEF